MMQDSITVNMMPHFKNSSSELWIRSVDKNGVNVFLHLSSKIPLFKLFFDTTNIIDTNFI